MGPEALWRDVLGQVFYALVAVGGAAALPSRPLAERLGLGRSRLGLARLAAALLGFLALSHGLHGVVVALDLLEGTTLEELDRTAREAGPLHPGLVWLALGLAPALGEELLFRGFLLRLLATRWPGARAVLGSAALFGAAHLDPVHGVAAFLLGVYLAALVARADSLWPAVLCHVVNNSLAAAGSAGLLPELGQVGAVWQAAAALALAGVCLGWSLLGFCLQPARGPADDMPISRGLDEDDLPGSDRR
jgi:hypothetical protein